MSEKRLIDNSNMLHAFDIVGYQGKDILIGHVASRLGIRFAEGKYPLSQVESALRTVIGEGAWILVEEMQKEFQG